MYSGEPVAIAMRATPGTFSIMRVAFSRASSDTAYDMRRYSVFSTAVSARSISAGSSSAMRLTTSTSANGSTRVGATWRLPHLARDSATRSARSCAASASDNS